MNSYIWGNLSRTNSDATLIDEAIASAVTSHNDDPDAHLGADQALQSHRAAEIIDHVAESVVNDKIRANARTYLAIVDPEGDGDFTNLEDACDYAYTKGSGSIYVKKGVYTPTRDLKLKYGIDIYGEGPNETVVDLTAATFGGINVSGAASIDVITVPTVMYTESDDKMYYDGLPDITPEDFFGVYMQLPWGDGLLDYNPFDTYIAAWDTSPVTGESTDVYIAPTVTCTTSSPIVHVNGWKFCSGLENGEGLVVYAGNEILGTFKSYLGNGDIELATNALSAQDRSQGLAYQGQTGRMTIVQGLSFTCGAGSYLFKVDGTKGRFYVRDAAFMNCGTLFKNDAWYNTKDADGVTIEDTVFYLTRGACNFSASGGTLRNCTFNFNSSSYPTNLGGPYSYFENCNFFGVPTGVSNRLASVQKDSRFNGCVFLNMCNGDIVNNGSWSPVSPDSYVSFIGCTFSEPMSLRVVFSGNNILVSGCRFYVGNAYVGLKSTTRYSTFTGCQGRGTLLTQPSNCIVTANGIWPSMS